MNWKIVSALLGVILLGNGTMGFAQEGAPGEDIPPAQAAPEIVAAQGELVIVPELQNVAILVDGHAVGVGTVNVKGVPAGDHLIVGLWPGARRTQETVRVEAGKTALVQFANPGPWSADAPARTREDRDNDDDDDKDKDKDKDKGPTVRRNPRLFVAGVTLISVGAALAVTGAVLAITGSARLFAGIFSSASSSSSSDFAADTRLQMAGSGLAPIGILALAGGVAMTVIGGQKKPAPRATAPRATLLIPAVQIGRQEASATWRFEF